MHVQRIGGVVMALAAVILGTVSLLLGSSPTYAADAAVQVVAEHSEKCLDSTGGSRADSVRVIQYACGHQRADQLWTFRAAGRDEYYVVALHSRKCLDVSGASQSDGAAVIQYTCGDSVNQRWRLAPTGTGGYYLVAAHSDRCLDVSGGSQSDGAHVIQYACGGGVNQRWRLS